jgi:hypothetical protein
MYMYNRNRGDSGNISEFMQGKIVEEEDQQHHDTDMMIKNKDESENAAASNDFMFQMDKGFNFNTFSPVP